MKDYKKILEGMVNIITSENSDVVANIRAYIDENCPELKEDEDERIIKALKEGFKYHQLFNPTFGGIPCKEIVNWLEKKGEQKPADKFEPKFKVGDKIRRKAPSSCDKDMQVARIEKDYYICSHIGKFSSEVVPFSKQSSYELIEQKPTWSEEDEKMVKDIIAAIDTLYYHRMVGWPESLSHQNRWKPSEKQMHAFEQVYDWYNNNFAPSETLASLYNDLKKL